MFSWSQIKHICANSFFPSVASMFSVHQRRWGLRGVDLQDSPRGSQRKVRCTGYLAVLEVVFAVTLQEGLLVSRLLCLVDVGFLIV
jgi:hypothetical protein